MSGMRYEIYRAYAIYYLYTYTIDTYNECKISMYDYTFDIFVSFLFL